MPLHTTSCIRKLSLSHTLSHSSCFLIVHGAFAHKHKTDANFHLRIRKKSIKKKLFVLVIWTCSFLFNFPQKLRLPFLLNFLTATLSDVMAADHVCQWRDLCGWLCSRLWRSWSGWLVISTVYASPPLIRLSPWNWSVCISTVDSPFTLKLPRSLCGWAHHQADKDARRHKQKHSACLLWWLIPL